MDAPTALWVLVPLALVHIVARRRRALIFFQIAVDVMLLLLPGRLLLCGLHIGPGAPGALEWGGGVTFAGTARSLSTATVTLSSWACQTGDWTLGAGCVTPIPGANRELLTFLQLGQTTRFAAHGPSFPSKEFP